MMRIAATLVVALTVVAGLGSFGTDQAQAGKRSCSERRGVLGVSRILEVDTTGGPRFGNMQYKDIDFLRPGEVVLTFDDGPLRPKTTAVLNALEAHCTKATFFMVGRMALVDPSMVKEIDRRGHTVATHTWSHKMQGRLGYQRAEKEIELGISAVSLALGKPVAPFFRFPYLSDPRRMQQHLKERGQGIFSIDVDSLDFRTRSGSTMVRRTLAGLKRLGKGVLLFHDIQRSTASGVDMLLDELAARGYKVVHLVPKKPATTLPKYDRMAKREADRRKKIASRRPLASRSIVWPVSNSSEFPAVQPLEITPPGLFRGPLPERSGRPRTAIDQSREESTGEDPEPAKARRKNNTRAAKPVAKPAAKDASDAAALRGAFQEDWRREVFNN
jgi:peptidoglycan-N-acetylglucosamine deacetylase